VTARLHPSRISTIPASYPLFLTGQTGCSYRRRLKYRPRTVACRRCVHFKWATSRNQSCVPGTGHTLLRMTVIKQFYFSEALNYVSTNCAYIISVRHNLKL
jgi:hypothetical protein